ncbi:uncharacterized protein DUF721 [Thermoflavifilum aggregans]|uniref:Uncharacterized protein DUF721 n=1 Tax=Thermoflavifilum aggregans TaxID=454188 RepID=A0A2M9CUC8_9BACT|nr:DUF721 domain-containing protein [Thermoflavifilum aggregans]MBX6380036.1 DUF721 domain-containing protein [Thermoflavifilum aggregans]PJJ75526.1 uncharacterized protein DUF721 [Thermoflavifilum aggregans]
MHSNELSIGEALKAFLDKSPMRQKLTEVRIRQLWEELMGKAVSKYTDNIQFVKGTLIITTHVAPLKQELMFSREKIKELFNESLQESLIEEVIIR